MQHPKKVEICGVQCTEIQIPALSEIESHVYTAVNCCILSGLWAVLNTACLCCRGRLESQDSSHWDALLKYNVIGTLRTARTFMPLLKNKSGKANTSAFRQ
jgi:NAD(P)-dependent dehydrogenase (short-subunit alcohol dehydrogenase family)